MIDFIIDYEWLVNLVSLSIFTVGLFLDEKIILKSVFLSTLIFMSYMVLLLSVFLNGLIKGF